MEYSQTVKIKNTCFKNASNSFHNIEFVKFLTKSQPIKIIKWEGIKNKDIAFFKLWFLGWKNFIVIHENYNFTKEFLSFTDKGIQLPLGIKYWKHSHIIKKHHNDILIIDSLTIKHSNILIGYLLVPILLFPIFIRKFLYKFYFLKSNKNS